jgi:hypothetical protein
MILFTSYQIRNILIKLWVNPNIFSQGQLTVGLDSTRVTVCSGLVNCASLSSTHRQHSVLEWHSVPHKLQNMLFWGPSTLSAAGGILWIRQSKGNAEKTIHSRLRTSLKKNDQIWTREKEGKETKPRKVSFSPQKKLPKEKAVTVSICSFLWEHHIWK